MKIAVIGFSGSGKSTLTEKLAKKYGAKALYLDTVHWLPGWKERSEEEKKAILEAFMNENDSWVIDGNYKKIHFERRMEEADLIVYLSFNRFACLNRVIKRYKQNKGKSRVSMTEGCNERLNFEFLYWVFHKGRTKSKKDFFNNVIKKHSQKAIVIKNQNQLNEFEKNQGIL
ncbi:MAG: DNA topology modulation protein FlaR [Clostridia bacterium]|nr:DNA topology modulation protein FlaR [Clostridia bacterium]